MTTKKALCLTTVCLAVTVLFIAGGTYLMRLQMDREQRMLELEYLRAQNRLLEAEHKARQAEIEQRIEDFEQLLNHARGEWRRYRMTMTAYAPMCPYAVEGWDYEGDPSQGALCEIVPGETIAAGRAWDAGTVFYIDGVGERRVTDRGGRIGNMDIDLAVDSKQEARQVGRQQVTVFVQVDSE